jgi:hypothetical protein
MPSDDSKQGAVTKILKLGVAKFAPKIQKRPKHKITEQIAEPWLIGIQLVHLEFRTIEYYS